jgi:hypothetical protein
MVKIHKKMPPMDEERLYKKSARREQRGVSPPVANSPSTSAKSAIARKVGIVVSNAKMSTSVQSLASARVLPFKS